MDKPKDIKPHVIEGDVIVPVKVLGVTLRADVETVAKYQTAVEQARDALQQLVAALSRIWPSGDR